jgi:hypothetical protein
LKELLSTLLDGNAFLPSALPDDLIACHVPFDELTGRAAVEAALDERARRGVAAAVVGASGSGKSAVTAWVFDRISTEFAPIRAPVFYETEETVRDPGAFARYLLQRLLSEAQAVDALDERARDALLRQASERLAVPTRTIGHTTAGDVGIPWLLKGEVAREVLTTIEGTTLAGSTDAALQAIDRTIEAIAGQGLTPLMVLDDTDRWLQVGVVDRRDLVGQFFGKIVRMLAERGCGLVVAVHDSYLGLEEYSTGTKGFLTDRIDIPSLPNPDALAAILSHRVSIQAEGASSRDVMEAPAVERLFDYYASAGRGSLRWTLQAVHTALSAAVVAGLATIPEGLIDDAAAA